MLKCSRFIMVGAFPACLLPVPVGAGNLVAVGNFTVATGGRPYAAVVFDNVVGRQGVLYTTTSGFAGTCYETYGCGSVVALAPPTVPGGNWTLTLLHAFTGPDGELPYSGVILDSFGALYGTTAHGGIGSCFANHGCGSVFKLSPPSAPGGAWTMTTLYQFTGGADGGSPTGNLIFDSFGALYGTTYAGGGTNRGTVYKLTPPATPGGAWTKSIVHAFNGADGRAPRANVIFDTTGAFYGTTQFGGASNAGGVFKLTPPAKPGGTWTNTVLYNFTGGSDGAMPFNSLQFDTAGALYGTTWKGAINNSGTAFKLTPPATPGAAWTLSTYDFKDHLDGSTLQSGLFRQGGWVRLTRFLT